MYFDVDLAAELPSVVLAEPDNFQAFEVVVQDNGGDLSLLPQALAFLGRVDVEGYAWFDQESVKRLAGERAADPQWQASFEGLVGYAREHGWVDEKGDLRAHCVLPG